MPPCIALSVVYGDKLVVGAVSFSGVLFAFCEDIEVLFEV